MPRHHQSKSAVLSVLNNIDNSINCIICIAFLGSILVQNKIRHQNNLLSRVKILLRGERLALRATLPPKPGDGEKPKRYTISTGLPATVEGLKLAVAKAKQIEIDLLYDRFDWGKGKENILVVDAIAQFEKHYWDTREKTLNRTKNYKYDYLDHFLYLPQDLVLSAELLKKALLDTRADSRTRRGRAIAYGALLNYFNLEHDLNKYKGNYQPTKKREIPTEKQIDYFWAHHCKSPQWKWVYGIIAVFGIRPHEIFHLNCDELNQYPPVLKVLQNTKTGSRLVYPIPNEVRVREWELDKVVMPAIKTTGKSNIELGAKISQKYNELGIPSPYHFRDAYAIRGEILNFNPATVAQWMGHSLDVHYKKYLRHISQRHLTDAWLSHQSK